MSQGIENLPIDIHFNKLLDWLINRRHCKQQWQAASIILREKINAALKNLPENKELAALVEGEDVNYFHCQAVTERLKSLCGEKNIFGQYSSQVMKDWSDIIKIYERDGMFLAETAQMIARNVNYEIPALKKQMGRCQQVQKECDKKETDYASKAAELRKKYASSCKELGIKGDKIKSELAALVKDLPNVYTEVASSAQKLSPAMKYYQDFSSFLMNSSLKDPDCVPMLRLVIEKGNVVTYEWTHGCKPVSVQDTTVTIDTKDEEDVVADGADIDWDFTSPDDSAGAEIDFDISGITLESGGTDEGQADIVVEQLGEEIDWGDMGTDVSEGTAAGEGVASGEEALTVLDNPRTRNLFLDDLLELEAFLTQRLSDMHSDGNVLSSSQAHSAPASIQIPEKLVTSMARDVRALIDRLTSVQIQHLMLIRNSPRYVDRLKESLRQTLVLADKMVFNEKAAVARREEARLEEVEMAPKVDVLVRRTKAMQKQMEAEISKKYKNRIVNIMGEINTI